MGSCRLNALGFLIHRLSSVRSGSHFHNSENPWSAHLVNDFMATSNRGKYVVPFPGELAGVQFLWNFGDGTTSTNESPVKVYGQAGSYTVSLRVDGEQGQSDVKVKPGFVVVVDGGPQLGVQWVDGRETNGFGGSSKMEL
jgi:PKD domain